MARVRAAGLSATLTSCVGARPARRGGARWNRRPVGAPVVGRWLFRFRCMPWCACAGGGPRRWGLPRNRWTDARQAPAAAQRPPHGHSPRARRVAATPTPPPPPVPVRGAARGAPRIGRPLQHTGRAARPYPPGSSVRWRRRVSRVPVKRELAQHSTAAAAAGVSAGGPTRPPRLAPRSARCRSRAGCGSGPRRGQAADPDRASAPTWLQRPETTAPRARPYPATLTAAPGSSSSIPASTPPPPPWIASTSRAAVPTGAQPTRPRKPYAPWRGRRHRLAPPRQPHVRRHRRPLPAARRAPTRQTAADPYHLPPSLPPVQ